MIKPSKIWSGLGGGAGAKRGGVFLFNTLNSISSLVNMRDDSRANEMILQLSDFLRHSLYIDPVEGITLKEELDDFHLYLRNQQALSLIHISEPTRHLSK